MQNQNTTMHHGKPLSETLDRACGKIAPLWPLENFVAVNPYLGLTDQPFAAAARQLEQTGGITTTMSMSFYRDAIAKGEITHEDIAQALDASETAGKKDPKAFTASLSGEKDQNNAEAEVLSFAEAAGNACSRNWNDFFRDRISSWGSSYFDRGQAQWKAAYTDRELYEAWRVEAAVDRTPEVMGLKGFRQAISELPMDAEKAAKTALEALQIPEEATELYLRRLLRRHGGWSAYIAYLDWDNRLYGRDDGKLRQFLCALLSLEYALFRCVDKSETEQAWNAAKLHAAELSANPSPSDHLRKLLVLQEAYDIAARRKLAQKFEAAEKVQTAEKTTPAAQAVFCIDVRSELFRRNVEMVAPEIETLGFAGFFGFPVKYLPTGHDKADDHCPVLLPASHIVKDAYGSDAQYEAAASLRKADRSFNHALKSFRSGAVSAFGFVSPLGLAYLPKLFADSFRLRSDKRSTREEGYKGIDISGIPVETKIQMATGALKGMSMKDGFARLVLLVGHGAHTVNNPHASGLDCGACAGRSGEANARVAAAVLNDPEVRVGLSAAGIQIPSDTYFIAGLHNTTTDEATLFYTRNMPVSHQAEAALMQVKLRKAGAAARAERAMRMHITGNADANVFIRKRSKDWSQVRPEWGLAGCSAFVVAPRHLSSKVNL
ncbi:MAG: putative inorganic carbon transporter subunit DabA, partial [Cryomorphaceae bacterium]